MPVIDPLNKFMKIRKERERERIVCKAELNECSIRGMIDLNIFIISLFIIFDARATTNKATSRFDSNKEKTKR